MLIFSPKTDKQSSLTGGFNTIWWFLIVAYFFGPPCISTVYTSRPDWEGQCTICFSLVVLVNCVNEDILLRCLNIQQISIKKIIYCTITLPVCLTLTLWAISCTVLLHTWLPLLCFYAFIFYVIMCYVMRVCCILIKGYLLTYLRWFSTFWSIHVESITKISTNRLYFWNSSNLSQSSNPLLHYSYQKVFEYYTPVWHYNLTLTQTRKLGSIRKRIIKVVSNFISWWTVTAYVYDTVYSELTAFKTSWARRAG